MSGRGPEFVATMDFSQVDRTLAETAKRSEAVVLSHGKLELGMKRLEAQSVRMSGYLQEKFIPQFARLDDGLQRSTRGFWSLAGGAKALQQRLAPQAAAISGISSALGENAGQAGKAVAGLGQLAAAYSAGGPWGAVLAAAGVGATLLVKYWDDVIAKQDEALMKAYSGVDAASALRQKAKADIEALRLATLNPAQAAYEAVEQEISAVEKRVANATATFNKNKIDEAALSAAMSPKKRQEIIDAQKEMKRNYDVEISQLKETIGLLRTKQGLQAARASAGGGSGGRRGGGRLLGPAESVAPASMEEWLPFSKWAREESAAPDAMSVSAPFGPSGLMTQARREVGAFYDEVGAKSELAAARFAASWSDAGFLVKRVYSEVSDDIATAGRAAFTASVDATSSYFTTLIEADAARERAARENSMQGVMEAEELKRQAFAMSAAQALQSTGRELIGLGTKQTLEGLGITIASHGLDPAGYALTALGGTTIAAGIGLGAGGAAIRAGAANAVSAAGGRGAAIDRARSETERGVGGVGSVGGGSRAGGGFVVNITYAAAGPAPEQTGREVVRVVDTLRSRQGLRADRAGPRAR